MEFVILGLLMIRSLTQYDIRNALQQKISPFFSPSLGNIQAALKKLEVNGHVEFTEAAENGRRKKIYTVTEAGKSHFFEWMLSSIPSSRLEQEVTSRLFFLGLIPSNDRKTIICAVVSQLESVVHDFEEVSVSVSRKKVPEHLGDIAKFQLKTLDLGLFYHRSMLQWFTNLLEELEDGNGYDE